MATDIERLQVTLEANLTSLRKQMAAAGLIIDNETKKAAGAAKRNLQAIEEQAAKSSKQIATRFQQAGYQIGDFAVQVASGQNALVALTQQGSQVLGAFGPWGAVLGAAGAVLGALLSNLDRLGGSASVNAEDLKRFNSAMEDSKQSAAVAEEGYDALIAKLGKLTETSRRALVAQLQQNIETNDAALRAGAGKLSGSIFDEAMWRDIIRTVGSFGEAAKDARRDIYSLAQGIQEAPQDPTKYTQLADILRALATNAGSETAEAFRQLADKLDVAAGNAQALVEKNQKLETAQRIANGEVVSGAKAILDAGNNAVKASGQISGLADAVSGLGQSFSRLRAQQNFTKAGGFIKYDPKMGEAPSIPDRPDLAKPYGETFPGVDPGQVALDELSQRFAYGSGSGVVKEKKASAKKTPDDKADANLAKLQAEIDLNTKLLAAYALGDAAMAKIRAQYDAVNAARQIGLKEGTAEYDQYVARAQAATAENAALEAKLKLMADGKSLTVEMQTEQEKLNAKLVEYKALLDAGAITQTTYERAVAKAKDQNDQLGEAIGAVGDAINAGIQGATSFSDALLKIGMQLINLLSKGLFGQGPLGGIFNSLMGVAAGGILGTVVPSAGSATQGVMNGTGFRRSFAGGGMAGPGVVRVGESGPELLSLSERGHVTPASATRRLLSGGGGSPGPVEIYVSGARGNAEIEAMVAAGVARGVKASRATVGPDYENYRIRFGGRAR